MFRLSRTRHPKATIGVLVAGLVLVAACLGAQTRSTTRVDVYREVSGIWYKWVDDEVSRAETARRLLIIEKYQDTWEYLGDRYISALYASQDPKPALIDLLRHVTYVSRIESELAKALLRGSQELHTWLKHADSRSAPP